MREAEAALSAADPELGALIARVGPCGWSPAPVPTLFQAVAVAVVHQQLSGKAAATIEGRVAALGAAGFPTPEEVLVMPPEVLRAAGLSGAKTASLRDLAARCVAGTVPTIGEAAALDDEALVAALLPVRGVGRWTVEMVLMFRLGRPDLLPLADLGIKKGFQRTFGGNTLPDGPTMTARGERWRPWRTVASWYLWRAADGG